MTKKDVIIGVASLLLLFTACESDPQFTVEGNIHNGKGKTLYFTNVGINKTTLIDSVKLSESGSFKFSAPSPDCYDFYRLQTESGAINLAIDSTESITIEADYPTMSRGYAIGNSPNNEKIKELTLLQMNLQQKVDSLIKNSGPAIGITQQKIDALIEEYKDVVKKNYIFTDPTKSFSYFALFQRIGGRLIFNPVDNREDVKCFAAVATYLNERYPHAMRSMHIYNIAIKGLKNTRPAETDSATQAKFNEKVVETGIINIELKDNKGVEQSLTGLKGKVVLLDFTLYQDANLAGHNMGLRNLYNEYHDKGFQIFQVSVDTDEHFWKTAAGNLPWICVRDEKGPRSTNLVLYGINKLPTFFLIDKENNIVARDENINDVASEIARLIKE